MPLDAPLDVPLVASGDRESVEPDPLALVALPTTSSQQGRTSDTEPILLALAGVSIRGGKRTRVWLFYIVLLCLGNCAWLVVHSYYVFKWHDTDMTHNGAMSKKYTWYFCIAFCCPSLDGLLNLVMANLAAHRWNHKLDVDEKLKQRDKKVRTWYFFGMLMFVALRITFLVRTGQTYVAAGFFIEFMPHVGVAITLFNQIARLRNRLYEHHADILESEACSRQACAEFHSNYSAKVEEWASTWKPFLKISIVLEVYTIVVQTLWCLKQPVSQVWAAYSFLILTEGFYIVFKLLPMAIVNEDVNDFSVLIVREALTKHVADGAGDDRMFDAAMVSSHLFNITPPHLRIFGQTVNLSAIKWLVVGNVTTFIVRAIMRFASSIDTWSSDIESMMNHTANI